MKNGPAAADILLFIEQRHSKVLGPVAAADVFAALDLDGAAAAEFMADYAREFSVDLTGYEPAFHHRDALRAGRFGWPIPVPHLFGVRLPLPVSTLTQAAQTGRWPLRYPILQPVQGRDWLNWLLVLVALPLLVGLGLALLRAV
jgi:hypothetical protein